jgi:deoxyribodipyrimidine photo-lyase
MSRTSIWWIRRDLRLADNQALAAALADGMNLVPLFILDPVFARSRYVGDRRLGFLYANLRALDRALQARGSRLLVRQGPPDAVLARMAQETELRAIHVQGDVSPLGRRREAEVAQAGLPLQRHSGLMVRDPDQIEKQAGGPYTVYSPYARAWRALPLPTADLLLPAPAALPPLHDLDGDVVPVLPGYDNAAGFPSGEEAALERLALFAREAVHRYADRRNSLDTKGTSALSPYLRFGLLSPRQAVVAALEARAAAPDKSAQKGADTWLSELIWREFYLQILAHFPHARERNFRPEYDGMPWQNDPEAFSAWRQGETGYPVVDAAMRQLAQTGWMHNRARMIVASLLVKDLLIDWRWGERWFMQQLLDGDPAANNGGWQWTAGTGTDAAPYFRIFNPVTQSRKFDPDGAFIRMWVPELAAVPNQHIHEPWRMSATEQGQFDCVIGRDYPAPIVDHAVARDRTLAAYAEARSD